MLDLSYFKSANSDVQLFQNAGSWQVWTKPRGAKLIHYNVVGAGAGGGGGFQDASTRSGGAGGGAGAFSRGIVDATILPDVLYIYTGRGGIGGLGGVVATTGSSGESSYISISPDTSSLSVIIKSGNVPATGGGSGSAVASVGGSGETIAVLSNAIFSSISSNQPFFAGISNGNGTAGSLTNAANNIITSFTFGGLGGGGTGTGGGLVNSALIESNIVNLAGAAINTNGRDGFILYQPIFTLVPGFGGGGGTTGGKGGNGSPGCGGGGGGAGSTSAGNGGNGGNGFVILKSIF